jgi:hypothetical protein|tara:strand:- start:1367 stop:1762 length:396 start_codon:yes stop_codon:yes gene_type:complete
MVKASNLVKKLLPIGLVIGGLYFLSQSKRVNIFKTTVPPDVTVNPLKLIPTFINQPQIIPVPFQETLSSLTQRFGGPLYTRSTSQIETAESIRNFPSGRGEGPNTVAQRRANYKPIYETIESFNLLTDDDE